jgi:stress-induced morphogen
MPAYKVDYQSLAPKVEEALREAFPYETIDVTEGWRGRVHVVVVSKEFNDLPTERRQRMVYDILEGALGPEAQYVTLVTTWGTADLR